MKNRILQVSSSIVVLAVVIFTCTNPQNPFGDASNAKISITFKDSKGQAGADLAVSDTVGNTVKIGVCPHLSNLIDSVVVTIPKYPLNLDSVYVLKNFSSDIDTQWSSFTFTKVGKWTVAAKAFIQGGNAYKLGGDITIFGKVVSATIQPGNENRVVDSIASFGAMAVGDAPFSYQWYHDTAALAGENGVSFVKSHISLSDSGRYKCLVRDKWGDSAFSDTAFLTVSLRPKVNARPVISVIGHASILTTEICSLTVSATDPDSGQIHSFAVTKGPSGYSFANNLFVWVPPASYLGTDSTKADTAIFMVTDNGQPALSDTQKLVIVVSAKIFPPDSVRGLIAVSRFSGSFVLKWNKSKNADQYAIYRSKDTTGFSLYATTPDTTFTNAIGDTAFYYYVVATNSKGSSSPSQRIHSTEINTAPKWSHATISLNINEGSLFSFDCADSCKDTNGDAITFRLVSAGGVNDSLIESLWKFTPSYSDSGKKTIVIKASDGIDSSILTLYVHVVNVPRPPQPQLQSLSTNRNTPLLISLTAIDPDGDSITAWTIDTQTTHGTTSMGINSGLATVTYTPSTGFMGTDYFTFKCAVGSLLSLNSARVSIRVDTNKIAPQITQPLIGKTLNKGDSITFVVGINATVFPAPLYSWFKAGTFLDSTRTNSWKKTGLALSDSGFYYVLVTNSVGKDSSGAKLIMQNAPVISPKLAATTTVNSGAATPISITVNSDAVPAPAYKWFFNNGEINGATAASYSKTWTIADTGTYRVVVSNAAGKDSSTTKLAVNVPPSVPVLVFPASDTCGIPLNDTLVWKKASGSNVTYRVQISRSRSFSNNFFDSTSGIMDTFRQVIGLQANAIYYWRVCAVNAGGQSAWATDSFISVLQWTAVNSGLTNYNIYWFSGSPGILFEANSAGGIFRSTNNGDQWDSVGIIENVATMAVNGANVFAGTSIYSATGDSGGMFRSLDTGKTWLSVNGLPPDGITSIVANGNTVCAATNDSGVYVSTDNGANFIQENGMGAQLSGKFIGCLATAQSYLFASGAFNGVYYSSNLGAIWSNSGQLAISLGKLYANNGFLYGATVNKLGSYRSKDNGISWTKMGSPLQVYGFVSSGNYVLAGTHGGVYFSVNNGDSFSAANYGFTGVIVSKFAISGNYVFALGDGASSGGIFRTTLPTSLP